MQYGYFDNEQKEYVITRPDTPTPWMNYLGNGGFGGIISATGGGMIFDRDPSYRRVTRYHFDGLPKDRPGRYLYIRNQDTGDFFSPTWQPVMKKLQHYECRHGLGYTKITGCYDDLQTVIMYCVPLEENFELWQVKMENHSSTEKHLRLFSYVEFAFPYAYYDVTSHWPRMAFKAVCEGNQIVVDTVSEQLTGTPQYDYIACSLPVNGFDCSMEAFIGSCRSETNPVVVEKGACTNSSMYSDNCVGVLSSDVTLGPGETLRFFYTLGATEDRQKISTQVARAFSAEVTEQCLKKLETHWKAYCSHLQVNTPCEDMNLLLNLWHAYQTKTTFD